MTVSVVSSTRVLLLLLATVLVASQAKAQPEPRPLPLLEALQRARENPPAVLAAFATLEKMRAQETLARSAYLPRMSASVTAGVVYDNRPVLPGPPVVRFDSTTLNDTVAVSGDWTAYDPARRPAIAAAHSYAEAQAHATASQQRAAMQATAELYFRALAARSLVEDGLLTVERRTRQLEAIRALVKAGVRASVDEVRANIDAVAASYALEIRKIDEQALQAALATAVGDDPTKPVRPEPVNDFGREPRSLESAIATALEKRPELAQLVTTVEARRADDLTSRRQRWPTLGVIASAQSAYNEIRSGIGISGHLYGGNAGLYLRWSALDPSVWQRPRVTNAGIEEAQTQLEARVLSVRAEVTDTAFDVQRARAALEQASKVLEAAEVARTVQIQRYERGIATILELLDAESVEQAARQRRIEAERDHFVARAKLLAVCGELGEP